jgi:hypothetical protein
MSNFIIYDAENNDCSPLVLVTAIYHSNAAAESTMFHAIAKPFLPVEKSLNVLSSINPDALY